MRTSTSAWAIGLSFLIGACSAKTGTGGTIGKSDIPLPSAGAGTGGSSSGTGGSFTGAQVAPEQQTPTFGTEQPRDSGVKPACGAVDVPAMVETVTHTMDVPGNVLFVFDQSGSMNEMWNGTTKIQGAIDAINQSLDPVKDKLSAGVVFFPKVDPNAPACNWATDWLTCLLGLGMGLGCVAIDPVTTPPQIAIQPVPAFLTAWNMYWAPPVAAKGGGTPTEQGMLAGEASLATPPPGNTVMVLVTDGEPTCGGNEDAPAARLLQKMIKTYVIGLPGANGNGTTVLDKVAIAGGTAPMGCTSNCFVSPSDPNALKGIFANIATTVVTTTMTTTIKDCSFMLMPPDKGNPADVHLVVTDTATGMKYEVPQSPTNGWTLSSDFHTATLTGSICDGAKGGQYSNFTFQYGCVMVPPLPIR